MQRHRLGESRFCKVDSYLQCLKNKHPRSRKFCLCFLCLHRLCPTRWPIIGGTSGAAPETKAQAHGDQQQRSRLQACRTSAAFDQPAFSSICIISVNSKFLNLEAMDAWPAPVDQASCGLLIHPHQVSFLGSWGKTIENPAVRARP